MSNLPVIDYIFIFLILLMVIHGYVKGFIEELFSFSALILAIWAAVLLNSAGGAFIRDRFMQNVRVVPELLAFAAILLLVLIVIKLLERVLKDVIAGANLGAVNKILGCLFGLVEGVAFTALIIFVLTVQPLFDASKFLGESIFVQYLLPFIRIPLERGKDIIDTVLLVLPEFPA
jgi:membrane protein required for colicin V production